MELLLAVALVLFLVQVVAWLVLPGNGQVSETSPEFSSIGDETKSKVAVSVK